MIRYTVYEIGTGRIIRTGSAMTEASANLQASTPGTAVILEGSDPLIEVVEPGGTGTVLRAPMSFQGNLTTVNKGSIVADGVDACWIYNVPNGARYDIYLPPNMGLVQPPDGIINDANIAVTTTVPGIYTVRLSYANFADFTVTFDAN